MGSALPGIKESARALLEGHTPQHHSIMSASSPPDPNDGMPDIRIPTNRSSGQQQRRATRRRGKEREQDHQQPNSPAQQGDIRNERTPPDRFESRAKGEVNSDEDEGRAIPSGQDGDPLNQGHRRVLSQEDDESPKGKEARPALAEFPKTPISPAYRPYQQDAEKATREIEGDIVEALECLKCYAADPNEIRHALENWMNQVRVLIPPPKTLSLPPLCLSIKFLCRLILTPPHFNSYCSGCLLVLFG